MSGKEAKRYEQLLLLENAGKITDLKKQVRFELIPAYSKIQRAMFYIADFTYFEGKEFIVEDVKGFRTDVYKLKKKLFYHTYKILIREV